MVTQITKSWVTKPKTTPLKTQLATPASTAAKKALAKNPSKASLKTFVVKKTLLSRIPKAVVHNILFPMLTARDISRFKSTCRKEASVKTATFPTATSIITKYRLETHIDRYLHISKKNLQKQNESRKAQVLDQFNKLVKTLSEIEEIPVPEHKKLNEFFELIEARNLIRMMAIVHRQRPQESLATIDLSIPENREKTIQKAKALRSWLERHKEPLSKMQGELDLSYLAILPDGSFSKDRPLTLLPKEIGLFTSLQKLAFYSDKLVALPKEIRRLKALEELALDNNRYLMAIPQEIGQLKTLQVLSLENNRLARLPKEIGALKALRKLNLDRNCLTTLPNEIGQLLALVELRIKYNRLVCLPKEIGMLKALAILELDKNFLVTLPKEIGKLTSLQEFWVCGNRLTHLPKEIAKITLLRVLSIVDNGLIDLHSSLNMHAVQLPRQDKKLQLQTILYRISACIKNADLAPILKFLHIMQTIHGKKTKEHLSRCLFDVCNRAWKKGDPLREKLKNPHFGSKAWYDPKIDSKLKLAAILLFKKASECKA